MSSFSSIVHSSFIHFALSIPNYDSLPMLLSPSHRLPLSPIHTNHTIHQWKVLVYDRKCRDIISPLLNVSKLRKRGVTLHLLLESEREDIPDVPAVYFVEPSEENIARITDDLNKRLYSAMYLNFTSKLDRSLMERLAKNAIAANTYSLVTKVVDQYLDFVTLEPCLFTLNQPNSYMGYNNPGASEADMEAYARAVTYGLFSVLATVGTVPVIRCASGGPAEMVARQLNDLVSEHLLANTPFFARGTGSTAAAFHRPLLILFDRNDDLITALHHTSTYQALVDDVLPHKLNRVTIESRPEEEGGAVKRRSYDLDVESDHFFSRYAGALFPEAIQANGAELAEVSKKEEEIRSKTIHQLGMGGGGGGGGEDPAQDGSAQELLSAVDSLPKLLERKKSLEIHTNILQAIMNVIAAREVPVLFDLEESMVMSSRADKATVKALLADPSKGSLQDKLRLLAVYTLSSNASNTDLQELNEAVRQAFPSGTPGVFAAGGGAWPTPEEVELGIGAVDYLRRQRAMQHLPDRAELETNRTVGRSAGGAGGRGGMGGGGTGVVALGGESGYMSHFINKAQSQATDLLAKASNLLARRNSPYVTRVVDNLCSFKPNSEDESFLYLDPKVKGVNPSNVKGRAPFREVIVFMIGGGCYAEYQNLQEYSRQQPPAIPRQVLYGCTELLNTEGFLTQLVELGRKSK